MPAAKVTAAVTVVLVVLAFAVSAQFRLLPTGDGTNGGGTTTCPTCSNGEQIVDILMAVLGDSTSSQNQNRTISMQAGTSGIFEVDVYPTANADLTMQFRATFVYSTSGSTTSGAIPTASFQPADLSIAANAKGVTYMTLVVPESALKGTYAAVVSAVDDTNSSNVWGLYFQLVVK